MRVCHRQTWCKMGVREELTFEFLFKWWGDVNWYEEWGGKSIPGRNRSMYKSLRWKVLRSPKKKEKACGLGHEKCEESDMIWDQRGRQGQMLRSWCLFLKQQEAFEVFLTGGWHDQISGILKKYLLLFLEILKSNLHKVKCTHFKYIVWWTLINECILVITMKIKIWIFLSFQELLSCILPVSVTPFQPQGATDLLSVAIYISFVSSTISEILQCTLSYLASFTQHIFENHPYFCACVMIFFAE